MNIFSSDQMKMFFSYQPHSGFSSNIFSLSSWFFFVAADIVYQQFLYFQHFCLFHFLNDITDTDSSEAL